MVDRLKEYRENETPEQARARIEKNRQAQLLNGREKRAKKSIRESLMHQMDMNAPEDIAEQMIKNGADPMDCTVHEAIAFSIVQKAMRGNVKAWETAIKLMGEDISKTEVTVKGTNLKDLIKERMESMDGTNSD